VHRSSPEADELQGCEPPPRSSDQDQHLAGPGPGSDRDGGSVPLHRWPGDSRWPRTPPPFAGKGETAVVAGSSSMS